MEIRFMDMKGDPVATRYWYHVPRLHDVIGLMEREKPVVGIVMVVLWDEDYVEIGLSPEGKGPHE
jgi:hypothetical protein